MILEKKKIFIKIFLNKLLKKLIVLLNKFMIQIVSSKIFLIKKNKFNKKLFNKKNRMNLSLILLLLVILQCKKNFKMLNSHQINVLQKS